MDTIVLLQSKWSDSPHVPLYLFFGGMASGTFLVAVLADLAGVRSARARVTARLAAYLAIPLLALAGFFLTTHLGKPERGLAFPLFFTNYESWMTRGGWIVGTTAPLMVAYTAAWHFGLRAGLRRLLGVVALAPAAAFGLYTGLLLSGSGFVPLWSRQHLPLLFLTSGLNTGLAGVGLAIILAWRWLAPRETGPRPVARWLGAALLAFVVVEAGELVRFMRDLTSQGLLAGHPEPPTEDRFQYQVGADGALAPGTYIVVVTWVNNDTGAEEGMSAETPVRVPAPGGGITVAAPRRLGATYNVYVGPTRAEARQVAANLGPRERVVIRDLPPAGLPLPENLQTGGRFIASAGGPLAYRYVTGGPAYPTALFTRGAEAAEELRGYPPSPTLLRDPPHGPTLAGWFWWGVVGLALVLPLALTAVEVVAELGGPRLANGVAAVKFASVLAGGLVLRFVVVWGGDIKAPLPFPPAKWPVPVPGPGLPGLGG